MTWQKPYAEFPLFSTREDTFLQIERGFVPNMRVPALCIVDNAMREVLVGDLRGNRGRNFVSSLLQVSNVAGLPGIVKHSIGLPDMHTGYGFSIGNVAAMNVADPTRS